MVLGIVMLDNNVPAESMLNILDPTKVSPDINITLLIEEKPSKAPVPIIFKRCYKIFLFRFIYLYW